MENGGIDFSAHFVTESAINPVGGIRQTARYTQQIDFGVELDLRRIAGATGGKLQILLLDRVGRSLSADAIGTQFAVQELYGAGQNFRLVELNYEQVAFANKLFVHLGWAPAGNYFASLPVFCDFQNGFICAHATPMTTNSGAHNYPVAQWGGHIKLEPTREFYVQTGMFQVNPNEGNSHKGFDLSLGGTGVFIPFEIGWLPDKTGRFPGTYALGAYHNSSDTPDVLLDINGLPAGFTGAPFAMRNGRWGGYGMADQVIWRDHSDARRLLRVGAIAGVGDRATSTFRYFVAAGGVHQGTFAHRDDDFVSVLFAYARTNPRLTQYQEDHNRIVPGSTGIQTYESVAEIDYNVQITPWLSIRPNLQYIVRPAGTGKIPNALVIGLYTGVTF